MEGVVCNNEEKKFREKWVNDPAPDEMGECPWPLLHPPVSQGRAAGP